MSATDREVGSIPHPNSKETPFVQQVGVDAQRKKQSDALLFVSAPTCVSSPSTRQQCDTQNGSSRMNESLASERRSRVNSLPPRALTAPETRTAQGRSPFLDRLRTSSR
ncbi:hypothetical protein CDAR_94851 [Caerostris darwini]|uniref:Uncharacterized protein n=1 Tax=Caerostris darwini TaxID=1538125 RepID=A0AAV4PLF8_9ARAC|nr:hypothetical protein CDAR_94851 [Caerostris darwini]